MADSFEKVRFLNFGFFFRPRQRLSSQNNSNQNNRKNQGKLHPSLGPASSTQTPNQAQMAPDPPNRQP